MSQTPEARFKEKLRKYLTRRGIFYSDIFQDGVHGKKGDPDIVACYRGCYIAFECKSATGSLKELQKLRRDQILASGGRHVKARNMEQVENILKEIDEELERWQNQATTIP